MFGGFCIERFVRKGEDGVFSDSEAGACRAIADTRDMTAPPDGRMSILMASGVPRRREGGVSAIIHNLGREMERRGHQVTYVFQEDLVDPVVISPRFIELIFSLRLGRHIALNRSKFSIVNIHAPVGFSYGLRRRWNRSKELSAIRNDTAWIGRTASSCDEPGSKEGARLALRLEEPAVAPLVYPAKIQLVDSDSRWGARVQPRCVEPAAAQIRSRYGPHRVYR